MNLFADIKNGLNLKIKFFLERPLTSFLWSANLKFLLIQLAKAMRLRFQTEGFCAILNSRLFPVLKLNALLWSPLN